MAIGDLWLVGSVPDDVYRSEDDGATWSSAGITAPAGQTIVSGIAVAPNGDLWLVGSFPNDVYRSEDDGATWSSAGITAPAGQEIVSGIAVAPNGDLWLAGSSPDRVYRSEDDGATWSSAGITAPAGQAIVSGIAVAPNGDLWLTGSSPNDVYRSEDDGATWSSAGITAPAGQEIVSGIAVAPNGDLWLTGSSPDDVYRSEDDGATWSSAGITAPAGQTTVRGIAFDPRSPTVVQTGDADPLVGEGSFNEPTGTSTAAEAATRTGNADTLEAHGSFGEPTGSAVAASGFSLSDFDDSGLAVEFLALLERPDVTDTRVLYADADHGPDPAQSPIDGELGLSDSQTVISRMLNQGNQNLTLNDRDDPAALDLGVYFGTGGAGADLTLWVQREGVARAGMVIADTGVNIGGGGNYINFACPTDFKNLLNAIAVGERYLFGGTRAAAAATTRTGDATALEAHGSFGEPTGASTAAAATRTGDATALEARGSFGEPTGTATGPAQATTQVEVALGAPVSLSGSNVEWGGTSAGPSLGDVSPLSPAAVALLRYFRLTVAASRFYASLRTVAAVADSPSTAGPDLSDLWEMSDVAVTLRVPGMDDLVLVGPSLADSLSDDTEPYQWLLSTAQNTAAWGAGSAAWFADYNALSAAQRAGTVLILDDGEAVEDVTRTGDATALVAHGSFGEPTGTRTAPTTGEDVEFSASLAHEQRAAGEPEVGADVDFSASLSHEVRAAGEPAVAADLAFSASLSHETRAAGTPEVGADITFSAALNHEVRTAGEPDVGADVEFSASLSHEQRAAGDPDVAGPEGEGVTFSASLNHEIRAGGAPDVQSDITLSASLAHEQRAAGSPEVAADITFSASLNHEQRADGTPEVSDSFSVNNFAVPDGRTLLVSAVVPVIGTIPTNGNITDNNFTPTEGSVTLDSGYRVRLLRRTIGGGQSDVRIWGTGDPRSDDTWGDDDQDGEYPDAQMHIQTAADGVTTLEPNNSQGGGFSNWDLLTGESADPISNLTGGGQFILAFTVPEGEDVAFSASLAHEVRAGGSPDVGADLAFSASLSHEQRAAGTPGVQSDIAFNASLAHEQRAAGAPDVQADVTFSASLNHEARAAGTPAIAGPEGEDVEFSAALNHEQRAAGTPSVGADVTFSASLSHEVRASGEPAVQADIAFSAALNHEVRAAGTPGVIGADISFSASLNHEQRAAGTPSIGAPPLALADAALPAGHEAETLALLEASGDAILYADTDRAGTDTPLDGELGIGPGDTLISRVWVLTATAGLTLRINDNDNPAALALGDYLSSGGGGNDLHVFFQTAHGTASFPVADTILTQVGPSWANFAVPDADEALIGGVGTGDRFIFGFTRLPVTVEFSASLNHEIRAAGTPEVAGPAGEGVLFEAELYHSVRAAGTPDIGSDIEFSASLNHEQRADGTPSLRVMDYILEASKDAGDWYRLAKSDDGTFSVKLIGRGWRVRARNRTANGSLSLPTDAEDVPDQQLGTPANLRPSRFPAAHSTLVLVEFDSVLDAGRYEVRHRNDGGSDEDGWTVVTEMTSADLLVLAGSDHVVQARGVANEDSFLSDSDWSASEDVTDQAGKPSAMPALAVSRASGQHSDDVTISAPSVPTGVTALAYQTRQDGGNWSARTTFAGVSVTVSLTGADWEVRWGTFDVEDGYAATAAGDPVGVPDQLEIGTPRNFSASRIPDPFDATVRLVWSQVDYAAGYRVVISQNNSEIASQPADIDGRTTTMLDVELDGANFTATIIALAPTDWINSELVGIAFQDRQASGPTAFADDVIASRSVAHEKEVEIAWTPDELAASQTLQVKQGTGSTFGDPPDGAVTLAADTAEATVNLQGSGWIARIRSTDAGSEDGDVEVSVPDQEALGLWRPYALADGSRTYDEWARDNQQDLGQVNMRLERRTPRSGAAGSVRVSSGNSLVSLAYDADDEGGNMHTDLAATRTAKPGVIATLEDRPGDDFVAGAEQSVSLPARVAMEISGLGITRPDPDTVLLAGRVEVSLPALASNAFPLFDVRWGSFGSGNLGDVSALAVSTPALLRHLSVHSTGAVLLYTDGPDLTAAWEGSSAAITLRAPTLADLVILGPASSGLVLSDSTEPYSWRLTAAQWAAGYSGGIGQWLSDFYALTDAQQSSVTLILDDGSDQPDADTGVNKNVTLTWTHATDRENRASYDIEIETRDVGAAAWEDATIITPPSFNTATGRWTAVCDADQRDGSGDLTTTRKQFRVQHSGYNTTPQLGAAYEVADSNLIENTAPNHAAAIFTT